MLGEPGIPRGPAKGKTMDDASPRGPARYADGRFGPGHAGRPRGARNRINHRVALSLLRHFEANEAAIVERITTHYFNEYLHMVGRMLPQEVSDPDLEAASPDPSAP